MKKFNIDSLVKKVLEESIQEKADELVTKIKSKVNDEWNPNAPVNISNLGEDFDDMSNSDDYIMDKLKRECADDPMSESCMRHKKYAGVDGEMDEELIGGQKKLDKDKNGILNKKDFKLLRKEKNEEVEEGNLFTDKLRKTKKGEKFDLGGKSYTDRSNLDEAEKFIKKAVKKMERKGTEGSFKEYCGGEVTKSCIEKAMDSGDTELIKKANFAKNIKAYEGAKHKKKSVKESLQLTEDEMITLIENIVKEEKKAKGMAETEKVLKASKKENDQYIKDVTKKMKDYLKDGSKGEYSMEPTIFPKGNGELAKMDKMTYTADKPVDEYIENFTAAGQENLVYDEIHPNDEWLDKNIEGSSVTGNNPEWANAVDTGVNKKRNKVRKDNLLGAVKAMAYNKAPQPVTDSDKSAPAGKFEKNFGKNSGLKANKILNQLESTEDKKTKKLNEEFSKINHLMGYIKKTQ